MDACEGGRCIERKTVDGTLCQREGSVTHYDPPEKLVLTLHNHEPDSEPALERISISLTDLDGRTVVSVDHQAFSRALDHISTETEQIDTLPNQQLPVMRLPDTSEGMVSEMHLTIAQPTIDSPTMCSILPALQSQNIEEQWSLRFETLQGLVAIKAIPEE